VPLDFRTRYEDQIEAVRTAMDGRQSAMWTALPAVIQSFDADKLIVSAQPSVQAMFTGPDQQKQFVNLPVCPDVPVIFPRGGGYELTFPIAAGDECLLVFSSRCIDNWWDQGGVQSQRELRMHDLSDGFCIPGPWSQKTKVGNVSTKTAQLRTDDSSLVIELDKPNTQININAKTKVNITTTEEVNVNAENLVTVVTNGKVNVNAADTVNVGGVNQINLNSNEVNLFAANQVNILAPLTVIGGELRVTGRVTGGFGGSDQIGLHTHRHTQPRDSRNDVEQPTDPPTPGT
jgi:Phage protein Gp138 N-terminal domain